VRIFAAFAVIEQVLLDVFENWEEIAAFLVGDGVPIGAGNTADQPSCRESLTSMPPTKGVYAYRSLGRPGRKRW
jgi:hypothetical protein